MIKKKMVQVGNSWGMVIPKAIIDGLQINPTTDTLEVYIADNEIRIRKRCDPRRHSGYETSVRQNYSCRRREDNRHRRHGRRYLRI